MGIRWLWPYLLSRIAKQKQRMASAEQINALTFDHLFGQTTMAEGMTMLLARGYLASVVFPPADLKGPGLLDWLYWNNNAHTATDGASYTSLLVSPGTSTRLKAYQVYDALAAAYNADKSGFLSQHYTAARIDQLAADEPATSGTDQTAAFKALTSNATGEATPDLVINAPHPFWGAEATVGNNTTPSATQFSLTSLVNMGAGCIVYWHDQATGARYKMWSQVTAWSGGSTPLVTVSPPLPAIPVVGDKFYYSTIPAAAKTLTDAQPTGYKTLSLASNFSALPMRNAAGLTTAVFDGHFASATVTNASSTRAAAPYYTIWSALLPAIWNKWFQYYASLGGQVDWCLLNTFMDLSDAPYIWKSTTVSQAGLDADASQKAALTTRVGWDLSNFDSWFPDSNGDGIRSNFLDSRVREGQRYESAMMTDYAALCEQIYDAITPHFPNVKFCDYHVARYAPSTHLTSKFFSEHPGLCAGCTCGTHNCEHPYDDVSFSYDDRTGAYESGPAGQSWTMPNITGLVHGTALAQWAGFTTSLRRIRTLVAASNLPIAIWTQFKDYNSVALTPSLSTIFGSDLWYEKQFHILLHGGQILYWNSTGSSYTHGSGAVETVTDLPLQNALTEANAAIGYQNIVPKSFDRIGWDQDYIATKGDCGGRHVWRVTKNPALTATVNQTAAGVTLTIGASELSIPGGRLHTPANPVSTLGWWIVQPRSTLPSATTYRRTPHEQDHFWRTP